MQFLIDADLPRAVSKVITGKGHIAIDVRDIGLGKADDSMIAAKAKSNALCLISGDFGFADIRNYSPEEYSGIVVLDLPKDASADTICRIVAEFLERDEIVAMLPGRLAIVSAHSIRLRPK